MPKINESCKKAQNLPQLIEVQLEQEGQRLDNFLLARLKGVPKSRIYRLIRQGEVRINKGRIKPDYRLQAGDCVRVAPLRLSEAKEIAQPGERVLTLIQESILYEDKGLLVLNKPSGIAVHGGSGLSYGVIEALRALRPEAESLELVHRLDRDTSGCLMIAKRRSMLRTLHELLRSAAVDKRYLTLVKGRWQGGRRVVDAPLSKNILQSGERIVKVHGDGKPSETIFSPQTRFHGATLLLAKLESGRTHQIRVHAAYIGHPVAGDEKYGDRDFNQTMRKLGLRRLFLHAQSLSLTLPVSGQKIEITAPLDPDLQDFLRKLQ